MICLRLVLFQPRSLAQVLSLVTARGYTVGGNGPSETSESLPTSSVLPQQYFCRNISLTIRCLRPNEGRDLFDLFHQCMYSSNVGALSLHDSPTMQLFGAALLADEPCVVFEDLANGNIVGYYASFRNLMMRSPLSSAINNLIIITKSYQVSIFWPYSCCFTEKLTQCFNAENDSRKTSIVDVSFLCK